MKDSLFLYSVINHDDLHDASVIVLGECNDATLSHAVECQWGQDTPAPVILVGVSIELP